VWAGVDLDDLIGFVPGWVWAIKTSGTLADQKWRHIHAQHTTVAFGADRPSVVSKR
jgi:hypothetical protein